MQNFSKSNSFGLLLGFSGYPILVLLDSIIKKNLVQQYPVFEIIFYKNKEQNIVAPLFHFLIL